MSFLLEKEQKKKHQKRKKNEENAKTKQKIVDSSMNSPSVQ
jgi:hypothetical protein